VSSHRRNRLFSLPGSHPRSPQGIPPGSRLASRHGSPPGSPARSPAPSRLCDRRPVGLRECPQLRPASPRPPRCPAARE
jgi:hypothetical protein